MSYPQETPAYHPKNVGRGIHIQLTPRRYIMAQNNTVTLIGNLGKDIQEHETQEGKPFLTVSLATQDSYKVEEEWKSTETCWHSVMIFRPLAREYAKKFQKGDRVKITGFISYRGFKDQEGYTRKECLIIGRHIEAAELVKATETETQEVETQETEKQESEAQLESIESW